jgi:gas vesicle protein
MSTANMIKTILIAGGAFAGGVLTGMLIAPKSGDDNRKWVKVNAKEAGDWLDKKGKEALAKSEAKFQALSEQIKKGVKDSVPNLYDAVDQVDLTDEELINN